MTKVSIVVLNWNRKEDTLACLKSLEKLETSGIMLQVIVVDNGSNDDSVKVLKKYKSRIFGYAMLENSENLGFTGGNNRGIKGALKDKSDYVMMLNNDTEVDPALIAELLKVAKKYPNAGIFSPKIYFGAGHEYHKSRYKKNESGKVIWFAGGEVDWDNVSTVHRGVDEVDRGQYDKTEEVGNANGACMFVRTKVFKDIGILDDDYYLYWEETDFCQRAKLAERKIYYAPRALVWHKVAGTSEIGGDLHDYFLVRNKLLFGFKYASTKVKLSLFQWSMGKLLLGSRWQRIGVRDYYLRRLGKGSWEFK